MCGMGITDLTMTKISIRNFKQRKSLQNCTSEYSWTIKVKCAIVSKYLISNWYKRAFKSYGVT